MKTYDRPAVVSAHYERGGHVILKAEGATKLSCTMAMLACEVEPPWQFIWVAPRPRPEEKPLPIACVICAPSWRTEGPWNLCSGCFEFGMTALAHVAR